MSPPDDTRIAVVGGSGVVGAQLVSSLEAEGHAVRIADIVAPTRTPRTEWVDCDVTDPDRVFRAVRGSDVVYLLAAAHGPLKHSPEDYRRVNVAGAHNVCQAADQAGVRRIVFTSTSAVYGRTDGPDEGVDPRPRGSYAESKLAAEIILRQWAERDGARSLAIVRPTVVFGAGGKGAGDLFLRQTAHPSFVLVGAGEAKKSLAYAANLGAFLAFLREDRPGTAIFNYADAPDLALSEIVSIVRSSLGLREAPRRSLPLAFISTTGASLAARLRTARAPRGPSLRVLRRVTREMRFDAARAHATGFTPPVPLRDAIATSARAELGLYALLARRQ